ncbi:serine/threonine-protein kinase [Streptomyces sp. NPDC098789]|uniref:serine/threonine-protein kinase n=1 Tax=Streptomyces sp. NPDC098789 TaxID=3366098 RepID=UPI00381F0C0F
MTEASGVLIGGRYRPLELVGQGGMGRVWRGTDEVLGREVAIKEVTLPPGTTGDQREVLLRRVVREARSAARLNHPGIITVHDVVEHEGAPVIVMEYVSGTSLAAAIARDGALPVQRVAEIGAAMLKALGRAHASGVVHRDVKPDNVLLTEDRVVLTDFGIAHTADATTALTRTGALIGTPAYMAPEQLTGESPAPATDLWALGATLYCAVEGVPPFSAPSFTALCIAVATEEPRPTRRAGTLGPLLVALLTKDPRHRIGAAEALTALQALARERPTPAPAVPPRHDGTPVRDATPHRVGPVPGPPPVPAHAPAPVPPRPTVLEAAPPDPTRPTARTVPPSPATARLLRLVGCYALLWVTGVVLPWNDLGDVVRRGHGTAALTVTLVLCLPHALPRPRWSPAVCWAVVIVADMALYFLTLELLRRLFGWWDIGFATRPLMMLANVLILGTGAWLLWWKVPGSRPA